MALTWYKARYWCDNTACDQRGFTESGPLDDPEYTIRNLFVRAEETLTYAAAAVPEIATLTETISRWRHEIADIEGV